MNNDPKHHRAQGRRVLDIDHIVRLHAHRASTCTTSTNALPDESRSSSCRNCEARSDSHALGPTLSYQAIESPRHKVQISENVARMFRNESLAELKRDPGDEIVEPA
ncbi:hypothetical protein C1Y08_27050 [Pseudomonas sp. FW306-02-F02-AA]|nr:hypothetical protein C1Y07_23400 [Pseudomonas sp. FW306-02-F02-AB]PMZ06734.1 hypothetical protein C1Y06_28405 [Pseudomonas sp. FW306-02-H06C]PMZ12845.1 hypothetical protein C1Y08_27050 [Pseudomonas sp. FW306-02-F02-AA]PMZ18736.1 hypothetical protein C1Y09_27855 [Pseudomonas sp. FW306-02-F08-AA]PMZ25105.1 hypothetical protein C1Y05_25230 [Pseudomonas sp. FW306-02-F04-BA]PMZ32222.1 hypothetical protein C1X99_22390 [Pseudomonas sp. FW306-02-H06B]PMZ38018.1 hypothetical protein C1Y00_23860 [Ps